MATDIGSNQKGIHTLGYSYTIESISYQILVSKEYEDDDDNNTLMIETNEDDGENTFITNKCIPIPLNAKKEMAKYFRQVADMLDGGTRTESDLP